MIKDIYGIKEIGTYLMVGIPILSEMEQEAFERWKLADEAGKEAICKELGEYQAKLILEKIEADAIKEVAKLKQN